MFRLVPNSAASSSLSDSIQRFLPGLWVLGHYQREWLRGDLLAGVVVAAYLVPQVMAYAEVAGLPAVAGLWASLAPLAIYAVLGTSRQLSVGPESSTALMTAVAVGALVGTDAAGYANAAAALAVSVGADVHLGLARSAGLPGQPAVPPGADRLHGRHRGPDDRQPARQGDRHPGLG